MTKELKVQCVVSEAVAKLGEIDLSAYPRHEIAIRGRQEMLTVFAIADASALPAYPPLAKAEKTKRKEAETAKA